MRRWATGGREHPKLSGEWVEAPAVDDELMGVKCGEDNTQRRDETSQNETRRDEVEEEESKSRRVSGNERRHEGMAWHIMA